MSEKKQTGNVDADGVRVVAAAAGRRRAVVLYQALALFLVACSAGYVLAPRASTPPPPPRPMTPMEKAIAEAMQDDDQAPADTNASAPAVASAPAQAAAAVSGHRVTPRRLAVQKAAPKEPEGDTSPDLRDFIPPGEKPTAGEVIDELHKRGIYEGIGAFNPPGTSPPLKGLAVPDDFELPEGYVRHYQATDDGQRIDPILMFSPDFDFVDENGNPIPIPPNRVVPPDMVPPGFPIRPIEIPEPREPGNLAR